MTRRSVNWLVGHPWYLVLVAGTVVFAWWAIGTRSQPHHVRVAFPSAFNLTKGLDVQVDGVDVGKIGEVEYVDGQAIVEMGISDEDFWPLHAGTSVKSRWGTTIGSGTRRLDVEPGPKSAPEIPEGGIIESDHALPAVDVDEVLNSFNGRTRGHLKSMVRRLDAGLTGHERALNRALPAGGDGLEAAGDVMADLARDSFALRGLVVNGDRLTRTLAARRPELSDLVTVAARTFETFAAHTTGVQRSIEELPGTLREARGTLARLDASVGTLDALMTDLRPGAAQLRPLAAAARPALDVLADTVPTALSTVRSATTAAPRLSELFSAGVPFVQKLAPVLTDFSPMLACMRPYAPEAGGAVVGLGGWTQQYVVHNREELGMQVTGGDEGDGKVRFHPIMAMPQVSTTSVHAYPGIDAGTFTRLSGKNFALPRPPGLGVAQPHFLPECGAGPESLDPTKDREKP